MRKGIRKLEEVAQNIWSSIAEEDHNDKKTRIPLILFYAPVGYGKSISAPVVGKVAKKVGVAHSLIHVLPSRSLVHNLFLCKYVYAVVDESEREKIRVKCGNRVAPEIFINSIQSIIESEGEKVERVAYQAGIPIEGFKKTPMFENFDALVSTFDSLAYTLLKNPVPEMYETKKHYAIPFPWIYTSLIYMDELHAYVSLEMLKSAYALLEYFSSSLIPVVASTATPIPVRVERAAVDVVSEAVVIEACCETEAEDCPSERRTCFIDEEFDKKVSGVQWYTKTINDNDVVDEVKRLVRTQKRVLIALEVLDNEGTLNLAIKHYEKLKNELRGARVAILHGKMTREQQKRILEKLHDIDVLIATPVINAGVDISFDAIITAVTRPETLVQFIGRVCRDNDCGEAHVYMVKEHTGNKLISVVKSVLDSRDDTINWHLYCERYHKEYGYMKIINEYYREGHEITLSKNDMENLIREEFLLFSRLRTSGEIKEIYEQANYSLVRKPLVEVLVPRFSEIERLPWNLHDERTTGYLVKHLHELLKSVEVREVYDLTRILTEKSITLDFEHARRVADNMLLISKHRDGCLKLDLQRIPENASDYIKVQMKERHIFSAFLLKDEKCFDEEIGLRC